MEIIRVNAENINFAKEVVQLFYWTEGVKSKINETFFKNKNNIMYVAVHEGKVVGNIYGYTLERFDKLKYVNIIMKTEKT